LRKKATNKSKDAASSPVRPFWQEKWPIVRYVLGFMVLLALFYSVYVSSFFNESFLKPYINGQAKAASAVLNLFGYQTGVSGTDLIGEVTLTVKKGCDGIEVTALYLIGILLTPFSWRSKAMGLVAGLAVLVLLNLLRIIGLYLAQVHWPSSFDFLHLHGGFALFTVTAIFMWMVWANWAIHREKPAA
jgi:exosortase/archaeosortase family protein